MGEAPAVPKVVGDAPHVGQSRDLLGVGELRRAGRQAEDDRSARPGDRPGDLTDLTATVGVVGDAVDLEKVHAPVRIELQHGVVPGLSGGIVPDAEVAVVPGAGGFAVGGIGGMEPRSCDRQVRFDRSLWNPANDVDAELEAPGVGPGGQAPETLPIRRRREMLARWRQQPVTVEPVVPALQRLAEGVAHVPALVDHNVAPAPSLQSRDNPGVRLELSFVEGEAVSVPTVPAHGRRRRRLRWRACNRPEGQ